MTDESSALAPDATERERTMCLMTVGLTAVAAMLAGDAVAQEAPEDRHEALGIVEVSP
jgi:hypothetical protein